jgi:hypothetical protein
MKFDRVSEDWGDDALRGLKSWGSRTAKTGVNKAANIYGLGGPFRNVEGGGADVDHSVNLANEHMISVMGVPAADLRPEVVAAGRGGVTVRYAAQRLIVIVRGGRAQEYRE